MRERLRDTEHLLRLAGLFAAGIAVFLVASAFMVPDDFGVYGHYRAGALTDIKVLPVAHADGAACAECHADVVEKRGGTRHAAVACQACHGALARHAEDPAEVKPTLPDKAELCERCHERLVGRPPWLPQVDPAEHSGGTECTDCHEPHSPRLG